MSTLTKEWLQKTIAEIEEERDAVPGVVNVDAAMALAAMKLALASLEAEPVAYIFKHPAGKLFWTLSDESNKAQSDVMPVYAAPPAPVVPWAWQQWIADAAEYLEGGLEADGELEAEGSIEAKRLLSRRAAMLQDQPVSNRDELPDGWIKCSERMPDKDGNYWGWWSKSKSQGPVWFTKTDSYSYFQSSEITHWMPLPEAPQQEVK
ncbi:TPA: DUF551 domain-containing protein [Enterobacter hormaechei subsp. xiangfangensis]|nr:DUF551 domain-containing protein [Enterobacter hormaechei subsp. xiangfangensis]